MAVAVLEQAVGTKSTWKRWTAGRKKEAVLRLLRGETVDSLSRELGIEIGQLEAWKTTVLNGMESMLKDRVEDPLSAELDIAKKEIGELHMEIELLRSKVAKKGVFCAGRW
jgi:transposase-like protein